MKWITREKVKVDRVACRAPAIPLQHQPLHRHG
jgi:hypothetical protein